MSLCTFHWSCKKQVYKDFICKQHYDQMNPAISSMSDQFPEAQAVNRLIFTRGMQFTLVLLRDAHVSDKTILMLGSNERITEEEIQRIRIVLKDRLTDD